MANPTGFPGVTGITGFTVQNPEATPEQMHGGPADPRHARTGDVAPFSWESQLTGYDGSPHGPQGYGFVYVGDEDVAYMPAGSLVTDPQGDLAPNPGRVGSGHAAPITRPLSGPLPSQYDAINVQTQQSAAQHAVDTGTSRIMQGSQDGLSVQQDRWLEDWTVQPGTSHQSTAVPPQLRGGIMFGTRSREQSFAQQNQYGFDSAHLHRRTAQSPIPGNNMWMRPGARPLVKRIPGTARPPVGQDSPFAGDDIMATYGIQGAVLQNTPTEYVAPPQAKVNPANPQPDTAIDSIALW